MAFCRASFTFGLQHLQSVDDGGTGVFRLDYDVSDAVFQVERHDPMPVDALIVGVFFGIDADHWLMSCLASVSQERPVFASSSSVSETT